MFAAIDETKSHRARQNYQHQKLALSLQQNQTCYRVTHADRMFRDQEKVPARRLYSKSGPSSMFPPTAYSLSEHIRHEVCRWARPAVEIFQTPGSCGQSRARER